MSAAVRRADNPLANACLPIATTAPDRLRKRPQLNGSHSPVSRKRGLSMTRCNCESTSQATKFSRTVLTRSVSNRCAAVGWAANVAIEFRFAEGQVDRLLALASDLVHHGVNVFVATGGTASVDRLSAIEGALVKGFAGAAVTLQPFEHAAGARPTATSPAIG